MSKTTNFADVLRAKLLKSPNLAHAVENAAVNRHIASEIYQARNDAGLTQKQLAEKAGTTQSVIARVENADYEGHSLSTLKKISNALNRRLRVDFCARPEYRPVLNETVEVSSEWLDGEVEFSTACNEL
ncbi:MAG: helix-turn-helix transcriptional regulator [Rhodopirellula sp.]|nr:helix-turn-helix transcriptional regulator [Rhodopirellula sp.]